MKDIYKDCYCYECAKISKHKYVGRSDNCLFGERLFQCPHCGNIERESIVKI